MSSTDNLYKIAYFTSIAGVAILFGFSTTLGKLKKDIPGTSLHEEGAALARKALLRGTLYAVCGFGVFAFSSYHLFGKKLLAIKREEYRKAQDTPIDWPAIK